MRTPILFYTIMLALLLLSLINQYQLQQNFSELKQDIATQSLNTSDSSTSPLSDSSPISNINSLEDKKLLQVIARAVNISVQRAHDQQSSQARSRTVTLLTSEEKQQKLESINAIISSGYIGEKDAEKLHRTMQDMDEPLLKQTLSQIFTAINRGEIQLEPGVII